MPSYVITLRCPDVVPASTLAPTLVIPMSPTAAADPFSIEIRGAPDRSILRLFDGDALIWTGTAGANGVDVASVSLAEGAHQLAASAKATGLSESPRSPVRTLVVDRTAPVVDLYAPRWVGSRTVPLTLSAPGAVAWIVSESSSAPAAGDARWQASAPPAFTLSAGTGQTSAPSLDEIPAEVDLGQVLHLTGSVPVTRRTFYAWAKDAAGNVSAAASAQVVVAPQLTLQPTFDAIAAEVDLGTELHFSGVVPQWQLRAVTRARIYPRTGLSAALVGGSIQGSNDGATTGFITLHTTQASDVRDGHWLDVEFANRTPYRWVKYVGPVGTRGDLAELELYAGATRLEGVGFGTSGSASGNPWENALDGATGTFYEGATTVDNYVGLDLAAGHIAEPPAFSVAGGAYSSPQTVAITCATSGAEIRYTTDGSDPAEGGAVYSAPILVANGTTELRAVASHVGLQAAAARAVYAIGSGTSAAASLHIGNSITDALEGFLQPLAAAGGVALDYSRYTLPGCGTWIYREYPAGGFGVANVQTTVRSKYLDHISMQPFDNSPGVPLGHADGADAYHRSDAVNIAEAWDDQAAINPAVQLWLLEMQPAPDSANGWPGNMVRCIWDAAGDELASPPPAPTTFREAEAGFLRTMEIIRNGLAAMRPTRRPPYILPAGRAVVALRDDIEAGTFPGVGVGGFLAFAYSQGGTDIHMTAEGRYFLNLVAYACMFQRSPAGLPHTSTSLTVAQAQRLQQLAWSTVTGYALSGVARS